jgi:hypothetical protein
VDTSSLHLAGGPSARVRLARVAREAALASPGVAGLDAGTVGAFATVGGGHRVAGVTCSTAPEGGYDLSLRLVCELVPLHAVADGVRVAIERAATEAQLTVQTVTITVADVAEPPGA